MKLGIRNYLIIRRFPPAHGTLSITIDKYCDVIWKSSESARNKIRQDYSELEHKLTQKVY